MGTIRAKLKQVQSLDIPLASRQIIASDEELILALNIKQLQSGYDSTGDKITPEYRSDQYAASKNAINPLPGLGVPDLMLTGSFYKGFYLTFTEKGDFLIDSEDSKALQLEYKYTKYIYGLTKSNKTVYSTGVFYDKLKKYITEKTGLAFK